MAERLSHTQYDDAPLSAARNPDSTAAVEGLVKPGDELAGRTITINRPRPEVYAFWRNFRNLPLFMRDLQSVTPIDGIRSHWMVSGPGGQVIEWDAVMTDEIPNALIAWTSTDGSPVRNSGRVEFRDAPMARGTEVTATIAYALPAGALGKWIATLYQKEPKIQIRRELRRFKQLMETGEVSTAQRFGEVASVPRANELEPAEPASSASNIQRVGGRVAEGFQSDSFPSGSSPPGLSQSGLSHSGSSQPGSSQPENHSSN